MKEINLSIQTSSDTRQTHDIYDDEFELPIDIAKRGKKLIIKAPIVGATEDDINITINNDVLFIHKGTTTDKERIDTHYVRECHWGAIAREVHLPLPVDPSGTHATLQNGVLRITLPIIEKKKTKIVKIT